MCVFLCTALDGKVRAINIAPECTTVLCSRNVFREVYDYVRIRTSTFRVYTGAEVFGFMVYLFLGCVLLRERRNKVNGTRYSELEKKKEYTKLFQMFG